MCLAGADGILIYPWCYI